MYIEFFNYFRRWKENIGLLVQNLVKHGRLYRHDVSKLKNRTPTKANK